MYIYTYYINIYKTLYPEFFRGTGICSYCVLQWNGRAVTTVGGPVSKVFIISVIWISLRCIFQTGLRSFWKLCFKKFGLSFRVPIPTQRYKNTLYALYIFIKLAVNE